MGHFVEALGEFELDDILDVIYREESYFDDTHAEEELINALKAFSVKRR